MEAGAGALNEHLGEARLKRLHALLEECLGVMRTAADLPEVKSDRRHNAVGHGRHAHPDR